MNSPVIKTTALDNEMAVSPTTWVLGQHFRLRANILALALNTDQARWHFVECAGHFPHLFDLSLKYSLSVTATGDICS